MNFKSDIKTCQGLVAHEGGHIGYGSFEISFKELTEMLSKKYNLPALITKKIINVVEDVRINAINEDKFPGFYQNLKDYTLKLLPELKIRIKKYGDVPLYINLYMENYEDFTTKPKFRTKVMSESDWKGIKTTKRFLLKTLTPSASIIACDQICKILKNYFTVIKPRRRVNTQAYPKNRGYGGYGDPVYVDESEYDGDPEINEKIAFLEELEHVEDSEYLEDNDFLEDPVYVEETDYEDYVNFSRISDDSIINQLENFETNVKEEEKTELNTISDKTIEKLNESDLTTEDLEKLIEKVEISEKLESLTQENLEPETINEKLNDLLESFENNLEITEKIEDFIEVLKESNEKDSNALLKEFFKDEFKDHESVTVKNDNKLVEFEISELSDKETLLESITEFLFEDNEAMEDRLLSLEKEDYSFNNEIERKVIETKIEDEDMIPIDLGFLDIKREFGGIITKIRMMFSSHKNNPDLDNYQKKGRLNKNLIKAITSEYKFNKCFTRRTRQKDLKILLLVDISGSMQGKKLESAKIAMIMLYEALLEIAKIRIVLFTGEHDARNILVKDFNEYIDPKKIDLVGTHQKNCQNLDGLSLKNETDKLTQNELVIVISDGQPSGHSYGLNNAILDIQTVRKRFKVFAFSIDAKGDYLNKLYGNNWILTSSNDRIDLGEKIIQFCRLVTKEFFR